MYTELHARSGFSFLEGASVPEELAAACNAYGMPAMAVLDRDRRLRRAALLSCSNQNQSEGAHWLRSDFPAFGWRYPLLVKSRERLSEFVAA